MRVGSLFSGIGGFELGLRAAIDDLELRWLCDNAEFPRRILSARFPDARLYGDSSEVGTAAADVELLVAGFPCQPVSQAGLQLAQTDSRWLWPEVARVIKAKQPLLVLIENVRGLLTRGLRDVLVDLAELGYDAQWDTISAYSVGAPHIRQRVFIVASREPLGRVFGRRPRILADWLGTEPLPRLARGAPYQTSRLEALGNAVVPQVVTHVAISAIAALASERWEPPATISGHGLTVAELGRKLRPAGALVDGHVYGLHSSAPAPGRRRLWPTPNANESAWSLEALLACCDAAGKVPPEDLLKRWHHAETGQIVQKNLNAVVRMVEAGLWSEPDGHAAPWLRRLFPTPLSRDHKGASSIAGRAGDLTTEAREALLPTPVASQRGSRGRGSVARGGGEDLATAARELDGVWPTPLAGDTGGRTTKGKDRPDEGGLAAEVAAEERLWLTPHGMSGGRKDGGYDGHSNELTMQVQEHELLPTPVRMDKAGSRRKTARTDEWESNEGTTLTDAAWERERLLPTPRASGGRVGEGTTYKRTPSQEAGKHGRYLQVEINEEEREDALARGEAEPDPKRLSPTWVEWMMGIPPNWTNPDEEVAT